jgi:hypothetical protein
LRALGAQAIRSPLAWVVACTLVLHVVGIGWGLPAADGWDDDGIAPRDFLVGSYLTFRPGHYFTYPPVHLVALTLLTLPVTLFGLARSATLAPPDVIAELVRTPYMTVFAVVARLITEAMALGIVVVLGRLGEEIWGRRSGTFAAAVAGLNAVFAYYSHTSNLDVPYLFWGILALASLAATVLRGDPKRLRRVALFGALAAGTKDQAYGLFVVSVPLAIALWIAADPWARQNVRHVLRELALSAAGGVALVLFLDGAVVNPSGFMRRLAFLTGTASQDHASYAANVAGWSRVLSDTVRFSGRYYPTGVLLLVVAGIAVHLARTHAEARRLVAGLVPLLGAASFTLAFNCVARRTEHRFLLPQSLLVSLYVGVALDVVLRSVERSRSLAWAVGAGLVMLGGRALFECIGVDVALLRDPRYDAEAWLQAHVVAGETVEVYGNNTNLPRFGSSIRVVRVDTTAPSTRSPLPGVTEVEDAYDRIDQRRPDWLVVSDGWLWRYTMPPPPPGEAFVVAPAQIARQNDQASRAYFASLLAGTNPAYVEDHVAAYDDRFWPRVDIHSSTTRTVHVFRRRPR